MSVRAVDCGLCLEIGFCTILRKQLRIALEYSLTQSYLVIPIPEVYLSDAPLRRTAMTDKNLHIDE